MKTTTLFRIGSFFLFALLVFACKKEVQKSSLSTELISQSKTSQSTSDQGPSPDWSVQITPTKNECTEQVFELIGINNGGNRIDDGSGFIEVTIKDANGVTVCIPTPGTSPLLVTTHLAPGTYTLDASISAGSKLKGQSSLPNGFIVVACAGCPYKGLDELTCADLPASMKIGEVTYNHSELCQLLAYNRGNDGYGALVRLAQAVLVAKANGFTSANEAVAAAEALIGNLNALDADDQASVADQYGAPEKGHVQDLVKCEE